MSNKKVISKYKPPFKQARSSNHNAKSIENIYDHYPVWQLKILDMEHTEWGWKNLKNHE